MLHKQLSAGMKAFQATISLHHISAVSFPLVLVCFWQPLRQGSEGPEVKEGRFRLHISFTPSILVGGN